jgi:hypothetical protein
MSESDLPGGSAGDPAGPEEAGERKSDATQPIGDESNPEQTQVPAPDDDAGGAEDEPSRTD